MKDDAVRRALTASALAATVAATLALAGCSGEAGTSETPSASPSASADTAATASPEDLAALEGVTVEGEAGSAPTLTFEAPLTVSAVTTLLVSEGDGEEIVDGQVVSFDYVAYSGTDATEQYSTYETAPESFTVGSPDILTELSDALRGQQVGVRILVAIPGSEETTVMALEVVEARTIPARAEGTAVDPVEGLPVITLDEDGAPSMEPVAGGPPTELVVQPLIEGDGAVVEDGQTVVVKYTGWLWDGTQFDSSWDRDSTFDFQVGAGGVIAGWDQGVAGQKVGSQLLLVVPPDLGYGEDGSGETIPGGATLVFVVDILDAQG